MKAHLLLVSSCLFFLLSARPVAAQQESTMPANVFSLLQQYDPLHVEIETNLKQLKKDRKNEKWQSATFRIWMGDSVAYQQAVKVATRGNMRKKVCEFPPVKIRFFEEKPADDSLADINELKLVVSCRNTESDEQLVLLENLAYNLYNFVSEESFRVKPVYVKFKFPGRDRASKESPGFFIESELEMASRLSAKPLKPTIISPRVLDSIAFARMAIFQFMIGNTDWGIYTRHNIKVIGCADKRIVAVPYDFDYAGLVDADYAAASPDIPIQTVRQRYYLGMCQSAELYQRIIDEYLAKKELILNCCEHFPGLTYGVRKDAQYYLNEFFSILEDPKAVKKEILESCDRRLISKD